MIAVIGLLTACSGGAGISDTTSPAPPTVGSSSSVSTVLSNVLDQATGTRVYFSTDDRLTEVDVDASSVVVHDVPELAPGDPLHRLVRRGEVLTFYGHTSAGPAIFTLDPAAPTSPALVDEAWFFVPSAAEDRIWLAILDPASPDTVRALQSVREVAVDGRVTVDDVSPPEGRWPVAAVDAGLVFQGDETLEVWDPEAQLFAATLPGPFPVATWHNRLVTCGMCDQLELVDLDSGTQRSIDLPPEVTSVDGYGGAFSSDGSHMAVPGYLSERGSVAEDASVGVVLVDVETGTSSLVPGMSHPLDGYPQVAWGPDGDWLFYSVGDLDAETGELYAFRPGDSAAYRVPVTLDGQYYGMATN